MENCLKTELNGIVNDNSLKRLGAFRFYYKVSSALVYNSNTFSLSDTSVLHDLYIVSDGVTFNSASGSSSIVDSKHAKIKCVYGNNVTLNGVEEGDTVIFEITPLYDINAIIYVNLPGTYYLDDFKYMTNLQGISMNSLNYGWHVFGSIDNFKDFTELTSVIIQYHEISGDIASLGKSTNLTTLNIPQLSTNSNFITGSFDGFVKAQKTNGRTSCEGITFYNISRYTKLTFGNAGIPSAADSETGTLAWNGNKVSLEFATSKKIYVMGYSASEIAELEAQSYTVVDAGELN